MNRIPATYVIALSLALSACTKPESDQVENGQPEDEQFSLYLQVRRITPNNTAHRERLLSEYRQRVAIAKQIEEEGVLDLSLIDARVSDVRRELIIENYLDRYLDNELTQEALRNYFEQNKEDYQTREVNVAHILFRNHSGMTAEEINNQRDAANQVYGRLLKGEDFGDLAREVSDDRSSAKNGGRLGRINVAALDASLTEAVLGLENGQMTPPIETKFGFQIVKLLGPSIASSRAFDVVENSVRNELREQVKRQELARLAKNAGID